ncbi:MAG TPA: SCO family protein [Candidatus Acidoferrales bacterium]|nr:SCO family protein [Candidatus Acidoferrales bacterium]
MKLSFANSAFRKSQAVRVCVMAAFAALLFGARPAPAQFMDPTQNIGVRPDLLKDVSIDQKPNAQIPMDLVFRDEHGTPVALGQFFTPGKPVVLSLVYFSCPMLCTEELNGLDRALKMLPMSVGKDFQVITVSIDPSDKPIVADAKHQLYTGMYERPGGAAGWHFLTADPQFNVKSSAKEPLQGQTNTQIKALADAIGYHYAYDSESEQFAHAALITVLTGEGRISRYFYGVNYASRDLRFGLEDASNGKIASKVDQVLLFCYHYDPHTGKYGLVISRAIQVGGALTLLALGILILCLSRGESYSATRSGHA